MVVVQARSSRRPVKIKVRALKTYRLTVRNDSPSAAIITNIRYVKPSSLRGYAFKLYRMLHDLSQRVIEQARREAAGVHHLLHIARQIVCRHHNPIKYHLGEVHMHDLYLAAVVNYCPDCQRTWHGIDEIN